jgi:hypothetical protein
VFSVGFFAKKPSKREEKRAAARRRTHLRGAKLLSVRNRPLAECTFYDVSMNGARLRLQTNIPLPNRIRVYDAIRETIRVADIIWRDRLELGLRFASGPLFINESEKRELAKDFYPQPMQKPLTRWTMIPFPHANCPHCQRSIGHVPSFRALAARRASGEQSSQ